MHALLTLLFAYIAFSVLLRLFALCGLLPYVQNYKGMLALLARLRFDVRRTRLLTLFALHSNFALLVSTISTALCDHWLLGSA